MKVKISNSQININTNRKKIRRPGAGRTVGSYSFVKLREEIGLVIGICALAKVVHRTRLS